MQLGVLERVPLNTPARWQSRMVCAAKHDGSPRRTVDYSQLNTYCPRQTHHTVNPWHLATSIPEGKRKTVMDNWHGYHFHDALETISLLYSTTRFAFQWGWLY